MNVVKLELLFDECEIIGMRLDYIQARRLPSWLMDTLSLYFQSFLDVIFPIMEIIESGGKHGWCRRDSRYQNKECLSQSMNHFKSPKAVNERYREDNVLFFLYSSALVVLIAIGFRYW